MVDVRSRTFLTSTFYRPTSQLADLVTDWHGSQAENEPSIAGVCMAFRSGKTATRVWSRLRDS